MSSLHCTCIYTELLYFVGGFVTIVDPFHTINKTDICSFTLCLAITHVHQHNSLTLFTDQMHMLFIYHTSLMFNFEPMLDQMKHYYQTLLQKCVYISTHFSHN